MLPDQQRESTSSRQVCLESLASDELNTEEALFSDETVFSMPHTVDGNLSEIYHSSSDVSEAFGLHPKRILSADGENGSEVGNEVAEDYCGEADEATSFTNGGHITDVDTCSQSIYSSSSIVPSSSTLPSRSGSAVTLYSLPELPSGCYTSDSDCPRPPPTTNLTKVKREVLPKIHSKQFRESVISSQCTVFVDS